MSSIPVGHFAVLVGLSECNFAFLFVAAVYLFDVAVVEGIVPVVEVAVDVAGVAVAVVGDAVDAPGVAVIAAIGGADDPAAASAPQLYILILFLICVSAAVDVVMVAVMIGD